MDAIFFVLHGAMVSQSFPDVEGELLERMRRVPGLEKVPIFGVFDLHANFTQRMAEHANCLVAYRENPHTDAREATLIAAALLQRCLTTGVTPRMFWQHPPIIWPPTGTGTANDPMRALETHARKLEAELPEFWSVSIVAGFSFADTPDTGMSLVIATTGAEAIARETRRARGTRAGIEEFGQRHRSAARTNHASIAAVAARLDRARRAV